jgi:hypothetical protein
VRNRFHAALYFTTNDTITAAALMLLLAPSNTLHQQTADKCARH